MWGDIPNIGIWAKDGPIAHNLSLQQVSRIIEDLLEENGLDACTKKENSKIKKIWGSGVRFS